MNPRAVVAWALFASIGYLSGGIHSAIVGLTIGLALSFLVSLIK